MRSRENEGITVIRKVGKLLPDYTASHMKTVIFTADLVLLLFKNGLFGTCYQKRGNLLGCAVTVIK
jgi:hypothetical protein